MFKKTFAALTLGAALFAGQAVAADYAIDKPGQHAFINFKISHLGYRWLYGTFNDFVDANSRHLGDSGLCGTLKDFGGSFGVGAKPPEASRVNVTINTASSASNQAGGDKHLRRGDFFNVDQRPAATFESTSVKSTG